MKYPLLRTRKSLVSELKSSNVGNFIDTINNSEQRESDAKTSFLLNCHNVI